MRIVHISTEFAPIAKAGGLGEVLVGLSRELTLQQTVDVIIPKYSFIPPLPSLKKETPDFSITENGQAHSNTMWSVDVEGCNLHLLETRHPAGYFERPQIYGYPDDVSRFIYFSRAVLEYLKLKAESIDVLHLHDWHTALCAPLVKEILKLKIRSIVLTIHNLEYQGKCAVWDLDAIGLNGSDFLKPDKLQDENPTFLNTINLLKGGINYADAITTVSPTYAEEILTPQFGHGLNRTLIKQRKKLSGILNGIDQKLWNPATDKLIAANYGSNSSLLEIEKAKKENRAALEKRFRIEKGRHPWIGAVTRLVPQKGPELLEEAMHHTLSLGGIFVLLGSSPIPTIQRHFDLLKEKYKGHPHLLLQFDYDESLAHLIYAALDFILVPSHFEPCGLTQLISMRYGTIPIVRSTGGLKDTVFDCNDHTVPTSQRNGFTFNAPSKLTETLDRAFHLRNGDMATFQSLIRRAIQSDSSWKTPALQYIKLYQKIAGANSVSKNLSTFVA